MSALLVANERAADRRFGSFNSISSRLGRAAGSVRFVESNQSNRSPRSRTSSVRSIVSKWEAGTGSVRSIQWMNWMNWIEWNERKTGKAPQSPLDQGAVIELTGRLPKVSFICWFWGSFLKNVLTGWTFHVPPPPRASLYSRNGAENCLTNSRDWEK